MATPLRQSVNPYLRANANQIGVGKWIVRPGEGDIEVLESSLTHPTHTDGFVDAGDPCLFAGIACIAMNSASASTEYIPVRFHSPHNGVIYLNVKGEDASGSSAIVYGQKLYVDTDAEVNEDATNGAALGIALAAVASGETTAIPVLLVGF